MVDLFKEKCRRRSSLHFLCNGSYAHRNSVGSLCGSEEKFDLGKLADGFIARWNFSSDIFIGILLILVFSVWLGWLPSYGRGETVAFGWWTTGLLTGDGLKHIILPAVTLAIFQIALVMRLVRSEMLEVMRTDYIRFARARGVPKRKIFLDMR